MLIKNAEIDGRLLDARIARGSIESIAMNLPSRADEIVINAQAGALIPGLHDHHIHLFASAAASESIDCSPPMTADEFIGWLQWAAKAHPTAWLRGIGYHESIAGEIDRSFLDACVGDIPIRIQHRSGRLWIFNSAALALLLKDAPGADPLERHGGDLSGRLYDGDAWLRQQLAAQPPNLTQLSTNLARRGVVGVTDASHTNGLIDYNALHAARQRGELLQDLVVFGSPELDQAGSSPLLRPGCLKIHLHENAWPSPEKLRGDIECAHGAGRGVAIHCVTVADLIFALSNLEDAGSGPCDRIEHASVVPPDVIGWMVELGVRVVTQPHFIFERGDTYLRDVEAAEVPWLYRARSLVEAGIPVAGGSDAPYGMPDPWASMDAAVERKTRSGKAIGLSESLSPEAALALYTTSADVPWNPPGKLAVGSIADLCLLDRPWSVARTSLREVGVCLTMKSGQPLWASQSLDKRMDNAHDATNNTTKNSREQIDG